jgi:hypothetical protein
MKMAKGGFSVRAILCALILLCASISAIAQSTKTADSRLSFSGNFSLSLVAGINISSGDIPVSSLASNLLYSTIGDFVFAAPTQAGRLDQTLSFKGSALAWTISNKGKETKTQYQFAVDDAGILTFADAKGKAGTFIPTGDKELYILVRVESPNYAELVRFAKK